MSSTDESRNYHRYRTLVRRSLSSLPPGPLGLSFSGGPDSLALALLLSDRRGAPARERPNGREIFLLNVEHSLRGRKAAEAEAHLLDRQAEALGLPLRRRRLEPGQVESQARGGGTGIEAAARTLRYGELASLCDELGLVALLTGHHGDDQLETFLLELIHAAPENALGGMEERRRLRLPSGGCIPLIRPLLSLSRDEIEGIVGPGGVEWVTDESNRDLRYERNHLRHRVIPVLQEGGRNAKEGLLRTAGRLRKLGAWIDREAAGITFRSVPGALVVEAEYFFRKPPAVRAAALERESRRRGLSFPGRSRRFLEALLEEPVEKELLDRQSSRLLLEGGGHRFYLHRGRLLWQSYIVPSSDFGYLHVVETHAFEIRWMGGVWPMNIGCEGRRCTVVSLPRESLRPPVVVRSRKSGDTLFLQGAPRLLKDLYDRLSIPQVVRENIPIIEDKNGILALPSDIYGFPRLQRAGMPEGAADVEIRFFVHGDFV
jgi:tRNA(Ile)-lysidine synthase